MIIPLYMHDRKGSEIQRPTVNVDDNNTVAFPESDIETIIRAPGIQQHIGRLSYDSQGAV